MKKIKDIFVKIKSEFIATFLELRKVKFNNFTQTWALTRLVVFVTILTSILILGLDLLFNYLRDMLIKV